MADKVYQWIKVGGLLLGVGLSAVAFTYISRVLREEMGKTFSELSD